MRGTKTTLPRPPWGRNGWGAERSGRGKKVTALRCAPALLVGALLAALPAHAADAIKDFPSRPLRLISPFAAGGSTDTVGRLMAPRLSERLGQNVVIDNRPGAGGMIGTASVAKGHARRAYAHLRERRFHRPLRGDEEPAVRSGQGLRVGVDGVELPLHRRREGGFAHAEHQRPHRRGEEESSQAELRFRRHGLGFPSRGGALRRDDRDRDDAHPVQGWRIPEHRACSPAAST